MRLGYRRKRWRGLGNSDYRSRRGDGHIVDSCCGGGRSVTRPCRRATAERRDKPGPEHEQEVTTVDRSDTAGVSHGQPDTVARPEGSVAVRSSVASARRPSPARRRVWLACDLHRCGTDLRAFASRHLAEAGEHASPRRVAGVDGKDGWRSVERAAALPRRHRNRNFVRGDPVTSQKGCV